jgi:hypothetical protein
MLVSLVSAMQIPTASASSRRYQSRKEHTEQLDDGIGDTFVSVFSSCRYESQADTIVQLRGSFCSG